MTSVENFQNQTYNNQLKVTKVSFNQATTLVRGLVRVLTTCIGGTTKYAIRYDFGH